MLADPAFSGKHKRQQADFTRVRKLPFATIVILLLQKGVKSLQLRINEFLEKIQDKKTASLSGSAFSQARQKLRHTVFQELNQSCLVPLFYEGTYRVWEDLRILAVDGSRIRLPLTEEIRKEFGTQQDAGSGEIPEYLEALASILYDVGNRITLDAQLDSVRTGERELARRHLELLGKNADLVIYDRGYLGYLLFALHYQQQVHFLCRCYKSGFKEAEELFEKQCYLHSKIVSMAPSKAASRNMQQWGITDSKLRHSITVRFVRVVLPTGEIEVLATSLLDEGRFPDAVFADLYHERWGSETYYDIIKNRLECENFSGKSAESVRQDFFSTVFLTNLESVLSKAAEDALEEKTGNRYAQQVNRNVSFNALKNQVFELLLSEENLEKTLDKLEQLFLTNPVVVRRERCPPRKEVSERIRARFLKYSKKHCF